jgi:hypothetical protein
MGEWKKQHSAVKRIRSKMDTNNICSFIKAGEHKRNIDEGIWMINAIGIDEQTNLTSPSSTLRLPRLRRPYLCPGNCPLY